MEAGHDVTLLTRGKKPVTFQIPDDTDQGFEQYKSAVKHIAADRTDADALKQQLSGAGFQGNTKLRQLCQCSHITCMGNMHYTPGWTTLAYIQTSSWETPEGVPCIAWHAWHHVMVGCHAAVVYDMNGREATDVEPVLAAVGDIEQYIFCSSAGVYLKSDQMPHREEDSTDPKSRHKVGRGLQHRLVDNQLQSCT